MCRVSRQAASSALGRAIQATADWTTPMPDAYLDGELDAETTARLEQKLATDPRLPECPQLKIVRVDGSLFFGAVDHVQGEFQRFAEQNPRQRHLLAIGNGINFIDIAGAEMLVQEAKFRRRLGGGVYLCKVKEEACLILKRGGFADDFGNENIFVSKIDAIQTVFRKLDRSVCERCDKRIFLECQQIEYKGEKPLATDKPAAA